MSLIPETLRSKSLLHQALFPQLFGNTQAGPASTPASPAVAASTAPARRPGLGDLLGQVFGGANDPRLSDEENKQARTMAIINAGLGMMQAGGESGASALGSIAAGVGVGQGTGAAQREAIYGRTQAERVRNALQDPAIVGKLTPEQRAMIALLPPGEAAKQLAELAFRAPNYTNVPEGNVVLGPDGKPMFENQKKPGEWPVPPEMRAALMEAGVPAGYDLSKVPEEVWSQAWERANSYRASGATRVGPFDMGKDTSEGRSKIGLGFAEKVDSEATQAMDTLGQLDVMEHYVQQTPTGPAQDFTLPARAFLVSIGAMSEEQAKNAKNQEIINAFGSRLALAQKASLPGPMSDSDRVFLTKIVPGLALTQQGNLELIEVLRRIESRKVQLADVAEQFMNERKTTVGLRQHLNEWAKNNPLKLNDLAGYPAPAPF